MNSNVALASNSTFFPVSSIWTSSSCSQRETDGFELLRAEVIPRMVRAKRNAGVQRSRLGRSERCASIAVCKIGWDRRSRLPDGEANLTSNVSPPAVTEATSVETSPSDTTRYSPGLAGRERACAGTREFRLRRNRCPRTPSPAYPDASAANGSAHAAAPRAEETERDAFGHDHGVSRSAKPHERANRRPRARQPPKSSAPI